MAKQISEYTVVFKNNTIRNDIIITMETQSRINRTPSCTVLEKPIDTNIMTLTRHILSMQKKTKHASGNFTILMNAITTACKFISSHVKKAGISQLLGLAGDATNATGDSCKKLDILANEVFINSLRYSGKVSLMISEENEKYIKVDVDQDGYYYVAFDPLDGSSNIDSNVSIGTIWTIFRRKSDPTGPLETDDLLQNDIISAGYCCYGSSTQIVYSIEQEVNVFTLDPSFGEFILTHPNIRIPKVGKIYSINEGNARYWDKAITEYIGKKKSGDKLCSLRYVGSMVADVHRTLLYGGIFLYPGQSNNRSGKLRILYESFPMAHIIEMAGGKAITGLGRILDIVPSHIHGRCPVIMGSEQDVDEVGQLYQKYKDGLWN